MTVNVAPVREETFDSNADGKSDICGTTPVPTSWRCGR